MEEGERIGIVRALMERFAAATGLSDSGAPPRRYLWTDAFAVCTFLELERRTRDHHWRELALELADQVHRVLGRHRDDDERSGWISGLSEAEGRKHPTAGGLRIGKALPERGPHEPVDERLEWERDGQYFHYLTKWMHALVRLGEATGEGIYAAWAGELAKAAHKAFVHPSANGDQRMVWKMSIDLTRPQVASMGHHDPLDGLVTTLEVARGLGGKADLAGEIADYRGMCQGRYWATNDPLGLGGVLMDAARIAQLMGEGGDDAELFAALLGDAVTGLEAFQAHGGLGRRADFRLAFRDLGLSIGLNAVKRIEKVVQNGGAGRIDRQARRQVERLAGHVPLAAAIEEFWLEPFHRETRVWCEHEDINGVMLATSLAPDSFLQI